MQIDCESSGVVISWGCSYIARETKTLVDVENPIGLSGGIRESGLSQ
jgi:hypothetical protein